MAKNLNSFTEENSKSIFCDRNIYELLGSTEILQIPQTKNSDEYALKVMEQTQINRWHFLASINLRKRNLSFNHNGEVNSVSFSGDGKFAASGSKDQSIRVWSLIDPKEKFTLTEIPVYSQKLTSDSPSKTACNDLKEKFLRPTATVVTHIKLSSVKSIVFCPNGKFLAGGLENGYIVL